MGKNKKHKKGGRETGKLSGSETSNAQEEHAALRCYNYSYHLEQGAPWVGGADFPTALPAPALPDQLFAWKLVKNL